MNIPKTFFLMVFLCALPIVTALQIDATASETTRWGVTTNKKLEKDPNTAIDHTGLEAEQAQPNQKDSKPTTGKSENRSAGKAMKSMKTKHPIIATPHDDALKNRSSPSQKAKKGESNMMPAEKDAKKAARTMVWSDEHHKMTCQKYLIDLKQSFLKTRHYSIQGAPCKTKEFAAAFLKTKDECIKDCPQEFLGQNGYTDRIIRNIKYLEKLGQDRCENITEAPAMPAPQTN